MTEYRLKLLCIYLIVFACGGSDALVFHCPSDCDCKIYSNQEIEFKHHEETSIKVRVYDDLYLGLQTRSNIQINCSTVDPIVHDILAKLSAGAIDAAEINGCSSVAIAALGQSSPNLLQLAFSSTNKDELFTSDTFNGLNALIMLNIASASNNLSPAVLDKLTSLESLRIGYNINITSHELNALSGHQLESFALEGNNLGPLTKETFEGLSSVSHFELNSNDIHSIEGGAFEALKNLSDLRLLNNRISAFPQGLLALNQELQKVVIKGSELKTLPAGFFSELPRLQEVYVRCNLTSVPVDLFKQSSSIFVIDLKSNALESLPPGLLADQGKLETLDLSHNLLATLPADIFTNLLTLRTLLLSHNRFKSIADAAIPQSASANINLTHNQIEDIKVDDLKLIKLYSTIDVSNNQINQVSAFAYSSRTQYGGHFILNNNPFECNCPSVPLIKQWQTSESKLFIADQLLCVAPSYVLNNDVHKVNSSAIQDRECLTFNYDIPTGCKFTTDESQITLIMNCTNAGLTEMPPVPSVEQTKYVSLEIHVENNAITNLTRLYTSDFRNVQKIYAANNSISTLAAVNLPQNLKLLDLSFNRLKSIPFEIPYSAMRRWGSNTTFILHNNPWVIKYPIGISEDLKKSLKFQPIEQPEALSL